jgi:hypothetical protein
MNATFSCHEPAARVACINLSAAEIGALIQHHQRQQKRNVQHHGLISFGLIPTNSKDETVFALNECREQFSAHESRLVELAAVLNLQRTQGPKNPTVGGFAQ